MSTRSLVGIKNEDGTYESIYVHWNGAMHHPILSRYYDTEYKVRVMIAPGAMSVLGKAVGKRVNFNTFSENMHHDEQWIYDQSLYFHRDRKDDWDYTKPIHSATFADLEQAADDHDAEYVYVFSNGVWEVYCAKGKRLIKTLVNPHNGNALFWNELEPEEAQQAA